MPDALLKIVALAVKLNDELAGMRDKIGDVTADRRLTAKVETGETIGFQMTPQQGFRACHRTAELLGASALDVAYLSMRHTPLPTLPRKGGGSPTRVLISPSTIFDSLTASKCDHSFPFTSARKP